MIDQDALNHREWENPDNWAAGIFYRSKRDSRWTVPKRAVGWGGISQSGWTLNFAHPRSSWVLLGLSSVPLGFLLLGILLAASNKKGRPQGSASTEHRTQNLERRTEPEHEPGSENPEL